MDEIAIASVPVQEWETPYELPKAFINGSIFPKLHKPFFVEEQMEQKTAAPEDDCEARLLEIQQVTFFLIDLTLFLDTHPDHLEAKSYKQKIQQERKQLMEQFAEEFYPLTMDCKGEQKDEVAPWEGGKSDVAL